MLNFIFATGNKQMLKTGADKRRYAIAEGRRCVREEYTEAEGIYLGGSDKYRYKVKEWAYYYDDDIVETVTIRECQK